MLSKIAWVEFRVEFPPLHLSECDHQSQPVVVWDCFTIARCLLLRVVAAKSREVETFVTKPFKILVRARCTWSIARENR